MLDANALYLMNEDGELLLWKTKATKQEWEDAYETLLSEELVGTCIYTEEEMLKNFGFTLDEIDEHIGQDNRLSIYDENVSICPVCGWYVGPDGDNCDICPYCGGDPNDCNCEDDDEEYEE